VPNIEQLIYASAGKKAFTDRDLTELLAKARIRNAAIGITGLLLYRNGSFLQILEGEPGTTQAVFDRIGRDPRHERLLLLHRGTTEQRNFSEWRMGFANLRKTPADSGFVDFFAGETFLDLKGDSDRTLGVLRGFREGKWRRHVDGA
jgi:Sensors of blue-light using FAD